MDLLDEDDIRKTVFIVEIPRALYVHATSGGSHYVRVGSTKQIILGPRLPRSYQNRDRTLVFDGLPVLTSSLKILIKES